MAKELDAAIISNDNYSDLLRENDGEGRIIFDHKLPSSPSKLVGEKFYLLKLILIDVFF